jgi:hypothetical protein
VRPQLELVPVGDPHDLLDLLDRLGHDDGRGRVVVPGRVRERVAELAQLLVRGEDGAGAERAGKLVECRRHDRAHARTLAPAQLSVK